MAAFNLGQLACQQVLLPGEPRPFAMRWACPRFSSGSVCPALHRLLRTSTN